MFVDKCVVALCDQWVIKYGEEEWKASVKEYLKSGQFRSYNEITQNVKFVFNIYLLSV